MVGHIKNIYDERGSVLPLTLIILAVLTTLSMMLSTLARSQMEEAQLLKDQWSAELEIHNSTQKVLWVLLTGKVGAHDVKNAGVSWPIDGTEISVENVDVRIQDVAGLMSLGHYDIVGFRLLLGKLTSSSVATQLANELGDWIDTDSLVRYKGKERAEYTADGRHGFPRNDHLRSLDELLFLPTMTAEIYNGNSQAGTLGLRDLLVPGGVGWFNAATAPEVLLAPSLRISEQDAARLLAARSSGNWQQFQNIVRKAERTFDMPLDTPSNEFRIISKSGEWKARMLIRLTPLKHVPFEILQWQYPDYDRY